MDNVSTKKTIREKTNEVLDYQKEELRFNKNIKSQEQFSSIYITKDNKDASYLEQNGININKSIELLGDMNTYNETLEKFLQEAQPRLKRLGNFKEKKDMINYSIDVHAMKNDSKYLGFTKLAELSLKHETEAKENNCNYISVNFIILQRETIRIINVIKKYLEN